MRQVTATVLQPVHKLRGDISGLRTLQQTGRFQDYLTATLDAKLREFISWDGEGYTDNNLEHHYMLLQSSTGDYIASPQLTTRECFKLLLSTASEHPKAIHIMFAGGYDATHILRDIPLELIARLKDNNPIVWTVPEEPGFNRNQYTINYLPHKWLEIRGYDWRHRRWAHIKLFDIFTFYGTGLIGALQSRNIPIPDEIVSGKAGRADFTYKDLAEIQTYCQQELELTVQLANQLREELIEANINITQWHGPAVIAKALLKKNKVQDHMQVTPLHIETLAQYSYFGGRFEQFQAGHHNGPVWIYDIHSAYPWAATQLPSLKNAEWEYRSAYTGELGIWLCENTPLDADLLQPNPLPWRHTTGLVGFPPTSLGVWLWTPEAALAQTVREGWVLKTWTNTKPFAYLQDLYNTRMEWKNQNRAAEHALKLGLNSTYGSLAQRVGGKDGTKPRWHQLEWAGLITSTTRAAIWQAIQQNPTAVISVETDSICTTEPLNLDLGDGLGQWELKQYDWITYLQSGIYFTPDGATSTKAKTRGINVREITHDDVMEWLNAGMKEPLLVNSRNFIGLTNPRTHLYGQWQDSTKELTIGGGKRVHLPTECAPCHAGKTLAERLHPLHSNPAYGTTPSAKHTLPWRNTETSKDDNLTPLPLALADIERRH